jgi:hypothetical protein
MRGVRLAVGAALGLVLVACPEVDTNDPANSGSGSSSSGGGNGASSSTSSGGVSTSRASSATNVSSGAASGSGGSGASGGSSGPVSGASSAEASSGAGSSGASGGGSSGVVGSSSSGGPPPAYVYAHSADVLYRLDADTFEVAELGTITFFDTNGTTELPSNTTLTDLAINKDGALWGCSRDALFQIEANTWRAVKRATLAGNYVGLTFVPEGILDPQEVLVGATQQGGELNRINLTTGGATPIGTYGGGWLTSGDVVAIAGDAMYATLKRSGSTTDVLARIEPTTGVATIIGAANGIGFERTYGLGYWGGTLYAFDADGNIISINRTTGAGTSIATRPVAFWGAGVTTVAKIQ